MAPTDELPMELSSATASVCVMLGGVAEWLREPGDGASAKAIYRASRPIDSPRKERYFNRLAVDLGAELTAEATRIVAG
jgi:hypothetical protein